MSVLIHAGIKVKPCYQKGPWLWPTMSSQTLFDWNYNANATQFRKTKPETESFASLLHPISQVITSRLINWQAINLISGDSSLNKGMKAKAKIWSSMSTACQERLIRWKLYKTVVITFFCVHGIPYVFWPPSRKRQQLMGRWSEWHVPNHWSSNGSRDWLFNLPGNMKHLTH